MEVIESETWKYCVVDSGCVRTDTRPTASRRKYRHMRVQDIEWQGDDQTVYLANESYHYPNFACSL